MTDKNEEVIPQLGTKEDELGARTNLEGQKKKSSSGSLIFLILGSLVLGAILLYAFNNKKVSEEPTNQKEVITSNRSLTLPPIPPQEIEAKPAVEKTEKTKPPVVEVIKESKMPEELATLPARPVQPAYRAEKKEPTLEELKYAAPLMGETATISAGNDQEAKVKGFAESMREQGFESGTGQGRLGSLMQSVSTPAGRATMMPDRTLLLSKGTFIDCVLETKLDTTVPGMTSCVIPRDVYSANGKVLLIERGSRAIGEYQGSVANGLARIFVLWTQIQTPTGVRVNLDSPGTDSLGGSGLPGYVDFHWWQRFGNALLFTLVQDAFEFGMNKQTDNNGGVNYYGNTEDGMQEIIREAMRQSGNIPPTLTKNQGERIGIFVARDVDFSSVYRLTPVRQEPVSIHVEPKQQETKKEKINAKRN